ncbi:hypothetical protein MRX96_029966 [Rhipicephalus microplus]
MAAMATLRDAVVKHRSRTRTTNWGDDETFMLIEVWQSLCSSLQDTKTCRPIYEQMSRILHGMGYARGAKDM